MKALNVRPSSGSAPSRKEPPKHGLGRDMGWGLARAARHLRALYCHPGPSEASKQPSEVQEMTSVDTRAKF